MSKKKKYIKMIKSLKKIIHEELIKKIFNDLLKSYKKKKIHNM